LKQNTNPKKKVLLKRNLRKEIIFVVSLKGASHALTGINYHLSQRQAKEGNNYIVTAWFKILPDVGALCT